MAFYNAEPFGGERGDLQAGIVASTVANVNRDPKKKRKPYEPGDFMPEFWKGQAVKKDPGDIYEIFRTWALMSKNKK